MIGMKLKMLAIKAVITVLASENYDRKDYILEKE